MDGRFVMVVVMLLAMIYVGWRGVTNPDATISTISTDLKKGQDLFEKHCAECHFAKEGIPLKAPTLGFYGQEYRLTDRQLVETTKSGGHAKPSPEAAETMTEEERKELDRMRDIMRKTAAKLSGAEVRDIVAFLKKSWTSDAQLEHWFITHQPPGQ